MPQFLFDTDHLTLYQYHDPAIIQRLAQYPFGAVAICPITIEEMMRGRLAVLNRAISGAKHVQAYAYLVETEQLFRQFPLVPFDDSSERRYQQLRSSRLRVGSLDLKIAAIALTNGLTVLTRNRADFGRVPGLSLEDWSA